MLCSAELLLCARPRINGHFEAFPAGAAFDLVDDSLEVAGLRYCPPRSKFPNVSPNCGGIHTQYQSAMAIIQRLA